MDMASFHKLQHQQRALVPVLLRDGPGHGQQMLRFAGMFGQHHRNTLDILHQRQVFSGLFP